MTADAPTLLLLHGLGGNHTVWDAVVERLDGRWPGDIAVPDLPGHGTSPHDPPYSFGGMAAAVAESLDGDVALVVGHSLGGVVGLALGSGWFGIRVEQVVAFSVKVAWTGEELTAAAAVAAKPVAWFDRREDAVARYLKVAGLHGLVDPASPIAASGVVEDGGRFRLAHDPGTAGVGAPDMEGLLAACRAEHRARSRSGRPHGQPRPAGRPRPLGHRAAGRRPQPACRGARPGGRARARPAHVRRLMPITDGRGGPPAASRFLLTLSCADRPGIVHAVAGFLVDRGGNILASQQFGDPETELFFMRVEFETPVPVAAAVLETEFDAVARRFAMSWALHQEGATTRTLILVSKLGHCLNDLVFRWHAGLLPIEVVAVGSNHPDFERLAASYGLPYHALPPSNAGGDADAEVRRLVSEHDADLVVLARYMQILGPELCRDLGGRIINIHHSFLPSFKGARPYHQAHDRGVKLIGATAHYVTAELDEGPIIEQDVERVDHSLTPAQLAAAGHDVESRVLARAVRWHAEHRVLLNGHRTVVFR